MQVINKTHLVQGCSVHCSKWNIGGMRGIRQGRWPLGIEWSVAIYIINRNLWDDMQWTGASETCHLTLNNTGLNNEFLSWIFWVFSTISVVENFWQLHVPRFNSILSQNKIILNNFYYILTFPFLQFPHDMKWNIMFFILWLYRELPTILQNSIRGTSITHCSLIANINYGCMHKGMRLFQHLFQNSLS
jgi:hypothetical protein